MQHTQYTNFFFWVWVCLSSANPALATGGQRLIGCLKLQVNFCKRATSYRAHLRKMTYKDKPSSASSPPCIDHHEITGMIVCVYICVCCIHMHVCVCFAYICVYICVCCIYMHICVFTLHTYVYMFVCVCRQLSL